MVVGQKRKYTSVDEEEGILEFFIDISGEDAIPFLLFQPPSSVPFPQRIRCVKRRRCEFMGQDKRLNNEKDKNKEVINIIRNNLFNSRGFPGRLRGLRRIYEVILGERCNRRFVG